MDYLWTPWRYRYIADAKKDDRCIFCDALAANDDPKTLIVLRGAKNFVILNRGFSSNNWLRTRDSIKLQPT